MIFHSSTRARRAITQNRARPLFILLFFIVCQSAPPRTLIISQSAFGQASIRTFSQRSAASVNYKLSDEDERFLEDLEARSFRYFWEQADPRTGLVLDRAHTDGTRHIQGSSNYNIASIASTGFGLTGICIAAARGYIHPAEARERVRTALRFFANEASHKHGWFYHFMDATTGERRWHSEVSSIDTALLLGGVLTARAYFREDREIVHLATKIYERVDFQWMLAGHPFLLSHGWKPETGFLKPRWDTYSEELLLYLLAMGSPTYPISTRGWYALRRDVVRYSGYEYVTTIKVPLFIHQYSHVWVDFRRRREARGMRINYFTNSIAATRAHRAFCMLDLAKEFPSYSANLWGITASDSAHGYVAWWGGPPRDPSIDGSLVPCAAGGSLQFTPDISLAALREMRARFGEKVYGRYGFTDAFNPLTGWINPDVIGINVGIMLLSAENLRTGNVWRWFMRNSAITRAMQRVALVPEPRETLKRVTRKLKRAA
jgi:hypothetical protein